MPIIPAKDLIVINKDEEGEFYLDSTIKNTAKLGGTWALIEQSPISVQYNFILNNEEKLEDLGYCIDKDFNGNYIISWR
jgi:hypothetical protein